MAPGCPVDLRMVEGRNPKAEARAGVQASTGGDWMALGCWLWRWNALDGVVGDKERKSSPQVHFQG